MPPEGHEPQVLTLAETNTLNSSYLSYLACCWLAQYQDNVTLKVSDCAASAGRSTSRGVAMNVHCHKSVPVLTLDAAWP